LLPQRNGQLLGQAEQRGAARHGGIAFQRSPALAYICPGVTSPLS
jgi:hypothetical protein